MSGSNGAQEIDFGSAEPIKIRCKISGKQYWLLEASVDAKAAWRDVHLRAAKYVNDKMVSVGEVGSAAKVMVARCLYEADAKGDLRYDQMGNVHQKFLVPLEVLRHWPDRVVDPIYEKVMEISNLSGDSAERVVLLKALARPDAPCSLERFREWASSLLQEDGEAYGLLSKLVEPTKEEKESAKNLPNATTVSSS